MLEVDKEGLEDLRTAFAKVNDVDKAFKVFAQAVYENAVDRADKHTITGALYKSIYLKPADDGYIIGADSSLAPYARFVHDGSKPHTITPNARISLRWATANQKQFAKQSKKGQFKLYKKGANNHFAFAFAKVIHHPGYKGDPFFYDAINEEAPQAEKLFGRFIDDL